MSGAPRFNYAAFAVGFFGSQSCIDAVRGAWLFAALMATLAIWAGVRMQRARVVEPRP